jgi:hypothetical protein
MVSFREQRTEVPTLSGVMHHVFDRYGFTGTRTKVLLQTIESIRETTTFTQGT